RGVNRHQRREEECLRVLEVLVEDLRDVLWIEAHDSSIALGARARRTLRALRRAFTQSALFYSPWLSRATTRQMACACAGARRSPGSTRASVRERSGPDRQ